MDNPRRAPQTGTLKEDRDAYRQILGVVNHDEPRARRVFLENFGRDVPEKATALEADIQAAAVAKLRAAGCMVIVHDAGNKTGGAGKPGHSRRAAAGRVPIGYPDVTVHAGGGVSVLLEFKRPGETPTDYQRVMHAKLEALGIPVYVPTSVNQAREFVAFEWARKMRPSALMPTREERGL